MKRTTIKLPDDLDALLRHEAHRRGATIAEVAREAIERHLGAPRRGRRRRRFLSAGAGRSGRGDISVRIEELLAREVGKSR